MSEIKQYHPALVVLHWLLALVIFAVFFMGAFVLDEMKNDVPEKIQLLQMHMFGGASILVLTILRLILRVRTAAPAPVVTDSPKMDKLGKGVRRLLYPLTVLAAISGMALAIKADLFMVLFRHIGALPQDFEGYAAHQVHALMAAALVVLSLLHVAAAMKHQFVLKDGVLSRMSLRKG
ncbi:MAG TPA: cytochrome b/b6 domain-containing protein [Gallionellaceae bacterium]|nr:cytochrome b/b6 domain-containing protein [Gallionellaceae bacterium]